MEAVYRKLTGDEQIEMDEYRYMANSICKKYIPEFDYIYTAKLLDQVFHLWLSDKSEYIQQMGIYSSTSNKKPTERMIIYGLGTVFGNLLNESFQSEWTHSTDQYGKEIGIRHYEANYTTFPYSSIQKRIKSKESNFFEALQETMRAVVLK